MGVGLGLKGFGLEGSDVFGWFEFYDAGTTRATIAGKENLKSISKY